MAIFRELWQSAILHAPQNLENGADVHKILAVFDTHQTSSTSSLDAGHRIAGSGNPPTSSGKDALQPHHALCVQNYNKAEASLFAVVNGWIVAELLLYSGSIELDARI